MTRENNIVRYVQEWHGGVWALRQLTPEQLKLLPIRVADNVIAYTGLQDTDQNIRVYAAAYEALIASGGLRLERNDNGYYRLQTP